MAQAKSGNLARVIDLLLIVSAVLAGAFGSDQYHTLMLSAIFIAICLALFDLSRKSTYKYRCQFFIILVIFTALGCGIWAIHYRQQAKLNAIPSESAKHSQMQNTQSNNTATMEDHKLAQDILALSRQMYLANHEPIIDIRIIEIRDNSKIQLEVINDSDIEIRNLKILERFYVSSLEDLSAQTTIGDQAAVPTINIKFLKPFGHKKCEAFTIFNFKLLASKFIKDTVYGVFLEFRMSFYHGVNNKHYSQVHTFEILASTTGWRATEINDNSEWVNKSVLERYNSNKQK